MPSEQFEHIQRIREDFHQASERVKDSLNNTIQQLADGLYSKHPHFIFELIQNAEDNTYEEELLPYLSFRLTKTDPTGSEGSDGALIIQNNETGFTHDNVNVICEAGKTTKKKAQGYIGEKGIGFKSVFLVTKNPHIFSNGYYFCLPEHDEKTGFGYIVPQWVDTPPGGVDLSQTHIILPLTKADFGYDKIEKMLYDIEPETILFLSKLQEIRIETDTGIDLSILKNDTAMPEVEILVEGNKQNRFFSNVDKFLVCTKTFDKPAAVHHEKREKIETRDVSIAFPLDENSTGVGKIFAYLPVRSDTEFPFLINADFILPSSREDIQDVPWNRWLMECVADLVAFKLLPLLKEKKLLTVSFLETLASKLNDLVENENDLFYPIFERVCKALMNEELLPATDDTATDDTFVSAPNAKLADSEGLIDLLNPNQLTLLFQRPSVTKWLLSDITSRRTPNLCQYLKNILKIDEVDPEMFARRLSEQFLEPQCDDWFIKFYKFLSVGSRPPKSLWSSSESILRTKPILRLQDNSLVKPDEPNVYLPKETDTETSSRFIKIEISQDEDAHKFLKALGVSEWDIVEEVIEKILPKYQNNSVTTSIAEYESDFSKIVSAYATDSQKKKDQLREKLTETPFILAETPHANGQIYLKPDQLYFGTYGLWCEDNLAENYTRVFVSEEICQFLKTLGIPEWDIVKEVIATILPKYTQNPPAVSINEHRGDFDKINLAYETSTRWRQKELSARWRQKELKDKLQVTPFIIAKGPDTGNPNYRKPNELYFETKELHLYFEGNDSYTFVNLDEYPDTARALLEDLGVLDFVRVKRRDRDPQGHVVIHNSHGWHRRGLDGFDPGIDVDGLEYAINNPTPQKSEFIWNEIAQPNSDCIRGIIEKSTRQTYESPKEKQETSPFGTLLIDASWLPDSAGNMHKPCELTLDDFPESFERNEQLANQLGIKKNEVAELAEKAGIPAEVIEKLKEPSMLEKFQEFMEREDREKDYEPRITENATNYPHESTQDSRLEPQGKGNSTSPELSTPLPRLSSEYTTEDINLLNESLREFQKWKATKTNGSNPTFPARSVANPERWKTKFKEDLKNLRVKEYEQRMRSVRVTAEDTHVWLKVNYTNDDEQMVCQICEAEMPFKKRNGEYYFEAVEAFTNKYFTMEHEAQFLALCPECAARYKEFVKHNDATIQAMIDQLMGSDSFKVSLQLGELDTNLRFVERHWRAIKEILKKSI